MKHFIITKFNLRVEEWKTAKDGSAVLTDEWLENRFDLFEKYCLPSVVNQSTKNFFWLIFFDTTTSLEYRNRIEAITRNFKYIKHFYIDGVKPLKVTFKQIIREHLDQNDAFIITSRMDNDDAIHKDFIATVQSLAIQEDQTVIDLSEGYQLDISNGFYEFRKFSNNFNPFVSVIEKVSSFDTVLSKYHRDWENVNSIISYSKIPLWIEVVHAKNKLNQTRQKIGLTSPINFADFGLSPTLPNRSSMFIAKNNLALKTNQLVNSLRKKIQGISKS